MRIGIIGDLHGYPEQFKKALRAMGECDMILCAGDILYHGPRNPILEGYDPQRLAEEISKNETPMLIARGNCDAEVDAMVLRLPLFTPSVLYEVNGTRFMLMHGHDVDGERLREIARIYRVDVMITGHTHIRHHELFNNTLFINPGSIGVPKGDGISSAAVFEGGRARFINIEDGTVIPTPSSAASQL